MILLYIISALIAEKRLKNLKKMTKINVAKNLVNEIINHFNTKNY